MRDDDDNLDMSEITSYNPDVFIANCKIVKGLKLFTCSHCGKKFVAPDLVNSPSLQNIDGYLDYYIMHRKTCKGINKDE